ncbi:hypothetical protein HD553DRAFT_324322 [Filobasidium floriforme]|uniref:uncharacterized protein n=1 Tax=Filobasidium floriforme TaxID=5210 RepID=UPI001E8E038C|nr:uncharacterized protein HD553DRAFT_324322 [Filobasidium floriforme]KAH8084205.1 hypothetical protein HD553DRAFT_324322 [Filobasidium floriforme]
MPRRTKAPPQPSPALDSGVFDIQAKVAKAIGGSRSSGELVFTVHTGKKDSKKKPYTGTDEFAHTHKGTDFRLVDDLIDAWKREFATEPKDKRKPDESSAATLSSTAEFTANPTQPSSTFVATDSSWSTNNWTIEQFVFANFMKEGPSIILSRRNFGWRVAEVALAHQIVRYPNSCTIASRISISYNKYNMSPQKSNPQKVSPSEVKIWLAKIQTAVRQAGEHGAKIIEGDCDTFLPAHRLLSFWYITASRPMGCVAGFQVNLIPKHHELPGPGLTKDNITVPDGRVVYVSVWYHPEKSPKSVLDSIREALKLDGPAADDAQPVSPDTPNQEDPADFVRDPDMGDPEVEASELSFVANGSDDFWGGVSSDAESDSDASERWDKITDLDLRGYDTDNSMFSAPATK